jgi:hypothetical protein
MLYARLLALVALSHRILALIALQHTLLAVVQLWRDGVINCPELFRLAVGVTLALHRRVGMVIDRPRK